MSVAASGVHCGSAVLKCPLSRRAAANRVDQAGAVDGPPELSSCGGTAVNSRKRPSESRIIPTMPGTLGNGSSRPTTPVSLVETMAPGLWRYQNVTGEGGMASVRRSEEHTSELQSPC